MSYFCYTHNWTSPIYSCPACHKESFTVSDNSGPTEPLLQEYGTGNESWIKQIADLRIQLTESKKKLADAQSLLQHMTDGPLTIAQRESQSLRIQLTIAEKAISQMSTALLKIRKFPGIDAIVWDTADEALNTAEVWEILNPLPEKK